MKHKYLALFLVCIMLFSFSGLSGGTAVSHAATSEFAGGTGTSENPWQIATADQLNNVRYFLGSTNSDKHFILVSNIDLGASPYNEGVGWVPIGVYNNPFAGNFDGNGKTITGLYINNDLQNDAGLFGYVDGGNIQNVALTNVNIIATSYVGGLVGYFRGTIANSFVMGSISGNGTIGGLVGELNSGNVENTWAAVKVAGNSKLGGLVGYKNTGVITSSYYDEYVAGQTDTGKGEPRSTADMTFPYNAETTYLGWNFVNIWDIQEDVNSGYPFIRQQTDPNAEFAGGDGSVANPYQIKTAVHLNNVRNYVGVAYTDTNFLLINDIDLTNYVSVGGEGYNDGKGWQPIGYSPITNNKNYTNCFYGSFDGGEHTISGLFINRQPSYYFDYEQCGLFGALVDADIRNLNLLDVQVKGNRYTGGLAGYSDQSTIDNIQVEGDVTGNELFMGGLIGTADATVITDSSMVGTVNGGSNSLYVGGLIGSGSNTTITGCHADTILSGAHNIGGLTGHTVQNTIVTSSYATGIVTGTGTAIGGLSGYNEGGSIIHSFSTVNVSGSDKVGGLCGLSNSKSIVSDSYAAGDVTGNNGVGGLIGENSDSSISNSYAVGAVKGLREEVGGLVGTFSSPAVYNSFYDSETTGQWEDSLSNDYLGVPKTTTEMMQKDTFSGWDFVNVWGIDENVTYPYLLTEPVFPITYTVNFDVYNGSGNISATDDGTSITTGDSMVVAGSTVVFTAVPATDWRVANWYVDDTATGTTGLTHTIASLGANVNVEVEFERIKYTITFDVYGGSGNISATDDGTAISTGDSMVVEGSTVVFTAMPANDWQVADWYVNSTAIGSTDLIYTIASLGANVDVEVEFKLIPPVSGYIVTVSANPTEGGTVTGGGNYETGDRVKVSATANENYVFINWTEGSTVVSKGATYNFKMGTENRNLVANFEATEPTTVWLVTVSAKPSEGGTVYGGGLYEEGDAVQVSATANDGYRFINWTEGLTEVTTDASYSFTMGTTERSLTANFLEEGSGWYKLVKLTTSDITATSVTLVLSQPVPDATMYLVYSDDGSCKTFDVSSYAAMRMDDLKPMTFYTFTVQAVYSGDIETTDGPSVKVKTKK